MFLLSFFVVFVSVCSGSWIENDWTAIFFAATDFGSQQVRRMAGDPWMPVTRRIGISLRMPGIHVKPCKTFISCYWEGGDHPTYTYINA